MLIIFNFLPLVAESIFQKSQAHQIGFYKRVEGDYICLYRHHKNVLIRLNLPVFVLPIFVSFLIVFLFFVALLVVFGILF